MFGSDDSDEDAEQARDFECVKCGGTDYDTTEIATAGSKMQKVLDVQSQKFSVVMCTECGYSEFYNKESSRVENVLDFAIGD